MNQASSQTVVGVVAAAGTIIGALLTFWYGLLKERFEDKRHARQMEIEERRAKFAERRLAIDLRNQREMKIFEARLASYLDVFSPLMFLEKRALPTLTPDKAVEIERLLKKAFYSKVSHCMSASAIEALTALRDTLIRYSKGAATVEDVRNSRLRLLQELHRDLGRSGYYLGNNPPLTETDRKEIDALLRADEPHVEGFHE